VFFQQGLEAGMGAEGVPDGIDFKGWNRSPGRRREFFLKDVYRSVMFSEMGQDSGKEDTGRCNTYSPPPSSAKTSSAFRLLTS
jgi:hypothetical protein